MTNIENCSGNIKLRLPKSLHALLLHQSQQEGVSLNQLCLMYLSNGIGRRYLGAEQFNHRLELIASECIGNDEQLFKRLLELNQEIEEIKPSLLYELKSAFNDRRRNIDEFFNILRYIYPVYYGSWYDEKRLMLKIPSAKLVLKSVNGNFIDVKKLEDISESVCEYASVAYVDYDYYISFQDRIKDKETRKTAVINVSCEHLEVKESIYKIRDEIVKSEGFKEYEMIIKPCYFGVYTDRLLQEQYNENFEINRQ